MRFAMRFIDLVKIPGKDFHKLSISEFVQMIESHINQDETYFDPSALSEFMLVPNKDANLEILRRKLVSIDQDFSNADERDGLTSECGLSALKMWASRLKQI